VVSRTQEPKPFRKAKGEEVNSTKLVSLLNWAFAIADLSSLKCLENVRAEIARLVRLGVQHGNH